MWADDQDGLLQFVGSVRLRGVGLEKGERIEQLALVAGSDPQRNKRITPAVQKAVNDAGTRGRFREARGRGDDLFGMCIVQTGREIAAKPESL